MDRVARSLFCLFVFFAFSPTAPASTAAASPASGPAIEEVLRKIESRHYRWIAIRTDVVLFFAVSGDSRAMCGGELLYQRLEERMFLTCVDPKKNLVFVFRTLDNRFDLYLPAQNTVYHGSIFDMEDSPDIESHLKPRDLYRALKPLAFDPKHAEIDKNDPVQTTLNVYSEKRGKKTLARKLYLAPEGDVLGEIYYNPEGAPVTQIQRYDFRELRGSAGSFRSVVFPKKITIVSPATRKGSAIFFANVKALDSADPLDFLLRVPPGTREIFLDDENPRAPQLKGLESKAHRTRGEEETAKNASKKTKESSPAVADKEADVSADADLAVEAGPADSPSPEEKAPPEEKLEPEGPIVQYPEQPSLPEDFPFEEEKIEKASAA